ncbi:hypothetical protein IWQ62_004022 [Dispira parvispora]|uniref:Uncharacterized protein n=1 Tax=Dispira parvispora TaxID=1520584 RepID=A0A9W8ASN9_9FUNG|nr:hypothetical protein IWQ62_004022 [Dispira parvispora]
MKKLLRGLSFTTPLLKRRIRGVPKSFWGQIYLFLAILEVITILVIQIILITNTASDTPDQSWSSQPENTNRSILLYDALFIVAAVFFTVIAWEAMAHKNTIQVIAATLFNIVLFVYSLIQYFQNKSASTQNSTVADSLVLRLCLIIILAICSLSFLALTWEIFLDFGWKIFKKLGADLALRQRYKRHQILITLLKLDVFFFIAYSVQLATLVLKDTDVETWLQIGLVIPGSVLVLFLAFFALHREIGYCMLAVMGILVAGLAYFVYRLVRMYTAHHASSFDPYWDSRNYLLFFVIVNMMLIISTLVYCWLCYKDFHLGLRQSIDEYQLKKSKVRELIAQNPNLADIDPETCLQDMEGRERWQLE